MIDKQFNKNSVVDHRYNEDAEVSQTIDTCGTRCPIPLLRAKQALKALDVGDCLEVLASDPSAKADFDAMLRHLPHELVSYVSQDSPQRIDTFIIRKGE